MAFLDWWRGIGEGTSRQRREPTLLAGSLPESVQESIQESPRLPKESVPIPESVSGKRDWLSLEQQSRLLVKDAASEGRILQRHDPRTHGSRLLIWCQTTVVGDGEHVSMTFDDVKFEYIDMCHALGWLPVSWCQVGRHFSKLTGGRKYRNVRDPRTGNNTAKERIYRIPLPVVRSAAELVHDTPRLAA